MKIKKYRISKDSFCGFEVQCWRLWFPFWTDLFCKGRFTNSHTTIEKAEEFAKGGDIVKYID